jgi:alkyl hydroperoxide reductase subunit AhpC
MDNLNALPLFINSIIDSNRGMQHGANTRTPWGCDTDVRKRAQQFDVVQETFTEARRCVWIVRSNVVVDLKEVFPKPSGRQLL